jgi:hypothetical protein
MLSAYHLPKTMLLTLLAVGMTQMSVSAQQPGAANANSVNNNDEFVQRDGTRLTLGGETFRFGGPNIEWLGLESYGPFGPMGPRYPSQFEIDDALDFYNTERSQRTQRQKVFLRRLRPELSRMVNEGYEG